MYKVDIGRSLDMREAGRHGPRTHWPCPLLPVAGSDRRRLADGAAEQIRQNAERDHAQNGIRAECVIQNWPDDEEPAANDGG